MQIRPKDNEQFLSTYENWNLAGLLESFNGNLTPVCIILLERRDISTGLLKEKGDFILKIWDRVLGDAPLIQGQRFTWNGLIFFSTQDTQLQMKNRISTILFELIHPQIKSLAIFSYIENDLEKSFKEIERMELQLVKINYWKEHLYKSYFEDGIEKNLV